LAGDFEKVLGTRPQIVTRMEDAGQELVVVSELNQLSPGMRPRGLSAPESFSIAAAGAAGSKHTVVLCGLICAAPSMRFTSSLRSIWDRSDVLLDRSRIPAS
jgi:hypothetical protein